MKNTGPPTTPQIFQKKIFDARPTLDLITAAVDLPSSRAGGWADKSTTIPAATLPLLPLPLSNKTTIINTSSSHNSSAVVVAVGQ
jgi:hypothetical protein